jgi:hypothetical protein
MDIRGRRRTLGRWCRSEKGCLAQTAVDGAADGAGAAAGAGVLGVVGAAVEALVDSPVASDDVVAPAVLEVLVELEEDPRLSFL